MDSPMRTSSPSPARSSLAILIRSVKKLVSHKPGGRMAGFEPLLAPFYLEDTDLGYMAWKRGWKVLFEPRSAVYHEHRGTIGKKFSPEFIQGVLRKNFILFCWKNI